MKSSYVLIIVVFVILVSATVIAKLASQIQLAPRRAPVIHNADFDAEQPAEEALPEVVEPIDISTALADGLITVTAVDAQTLTIARLKNEQHPPQLIAIPMGTAVRMAAGAGTEADPASNNATPLFVTYPDHDFAADQETLDVTVLACHIAPTIDSQAQLEIVSAGRRWTQLVATQEFQDASPDVRKYAVWTLGSNIRLTDLQPALSSPALDPRLKTKAIPDDDYTTLSAVIASSGIVDFKTLPLYSDLKTAKIQSAAVAKIHAAYSAFDAQDNESLAKSITEIEPDTTEVRFATSPPILVEATGIGLLKVLRESTQPTLDSLPSATVQQIDKVIAQLKSANYPTDDLESRLTPLVQSHLNRSLENAQLGQVRFLADRMDSQLVATDIILKCRSAETEFLTICERNLRELEDDEILPSSAIAECKLVFAPDEKSLKRLDALHSIPLDDIAKSKRRDVMRQLSTLYLELAEAAAKAELPAMAILYANQALAQDVKAPGVSSKAKRLLRTVTPKK